MACIIMRATLHHPAPNTYYGQWLAISDLIWRLNFRANAHIRIRHAALSTGFDHDRERSAVR
jgi:hypothetical protein